MNEILFRPVSYTSTQVHACRCCPFTPRARSLTCVSESRRTLTGVPSASLAKMLSDVRHRFLRAARSCLSGLGAPIHPHGWWRTVWAAAADGPVASCGLRGRASTHAAGARGEVVAVAAVVPRDRAAVVLSPTGVRPAALLTPDGWLATVVAATEVAREAPPPAEVAPCRSSRQRAPASAARYRSLVSRCCCLACRSSKRSCSHSARERSSCAKRECAGWV